MGVWIWVGVGLVLLSKSKHAVWGSLADGEIGQVVVDMWWWPDKPIVYFRVERSRQILT